MLGYTCEGVKFTTNKQLKSLNRCTQIKKCEKHT